MARGGDGKMALVTRDVQAEKADIDKTVAGRTGGGGVSHYNTLSPEQVQYIANHCEAVVAFVEDEGFLAKFETVRDRLPHLKHIVMFKGQAPGAISWSDFMHNGEEASRRDPDAF